MRSLVALVLASGLVVACGGNPEPATPVTTVASAPPPAPPAEDELKIEDVVVGTGPGRAALSRRSRLYCWGVRSNPANSSSSSARRRS